MFGDSNKQLDEKVNDQYSLVIYDHDIFMFNLLFWSHSNGSTTALTMVKQHHQYCTVIKAIEIQLEIKWQTNLSLLLISIPRVLYWSWYNIIDLVFISLFCYCANPREIKYSKSTSFSVCWCTNLVKNNVIYKSDRLRKVWRYQRGN